MTNARAAQPTAGSSPTAAATAYCEPQATASLVDQHFPDISIASANLPDVENTSAMLQCARPGARLRGINFVVQWSQVVSFNAQGQRTYNWSSVDAALQPYIDEGHKINVLFWGAAQKTNQQISGSVTPQYIIGRVTIATCRGSDELAVPVWWEATMRDSYRHGFEQMLARYKGRALSFGGRASNTG